MKKLLLICSIIGLVLPGFSQTVYNVGADTYVRPDTEADNNFGDDDNVIIKTHTDFELNSSTRKGFLKFHVDPLADDKVVESAEVNFTTYYSYLEYLEFNVFSISDDSWEENSITWNNAPELGDSVGVLVIDHKIGTEDPAIDFQVDLTEYVNGQLESGDTVISFALYDVTPYNGHIRFFSKEHETDSDQAAKLTVTLMDDPSVGFQEDETVLLNIYSYNHTVYISGEDVQGLQLFDLTGRQVLNITERMSAGSTCFVPEDGIYIVRALRKDGSFHTQKLLIQ